MFNILCYGSFWSFWSFMEVFVIQFFSHICLRHIHANRRNNWNFAVKMLNPLNANPPKMVKHTQTILRLLPTNCLSVLDHFVRLATRRFKIMLRLSDFCNSIIAYLHNISSRESFVIKSNFKIYFWPMFPFFTPRKHRKTTGFLVFSGGAKWDHGQK